MGDETTVSVSAWAVPAPTLEKSAASFNSSLELGNIRVAVRVRELLPRELLDGAAPALDIDEAARTITTRSRATNQQHGFTFDKVFGPSVRKGAVYDAVVASSLRLFFDGYNATVLAYGQTGGGKTFTVTEIMPQVARDLFSTVKGREQSGAFCQVSMQYVELYNEELRDLLVHHNHASSSAHGHGAHAAFSSTPLPAPGGGAVSIREAPGGEIFLEGAAEAVVNSESHFMSMASIGNSSRSTSATQLNDLSSRSHAILIITLQQQLPPDPTTGEVDLLCSKLHLVDLAGSERTKKSRVAGQRLKEAVNINQGLLGLGNVISALGDESKRAAHVPYRDSKLTRLLQDSLGGNSVTTMIACVSCGDDSIDETLNTLKYANRARNIRNTPTVNRDSLRGLDDNVDERRALTLLRSAVEQLPCSGGGKHARANPSAMLRDLLDAPPRGAHACVAALRSLVGALGGAPGGSAGVGGGKQGGGQEAAALQALLEQAREDVADARAERDALARQLASALAESPSQRPQHDGARRRPSAVTSHPVTDLTEPGRGDALGGLLDAPQLHERLVEMESTLATRTAELGATSAELAMARDDLERDEVIFSAKLAEMSKLQRQLLDTVEAAWQQQQEYEATIAHLKTENLAAAAAAAALREAQEDAGTGVVRLHLSSVSASPLHAPPGIGIISLPNRPLHSQRYTGDSITTATSSAAGDDLDAALGGLTYSGMPSASAGSSPLGRWSSAGDSGHHHRGVAVEELVAALGAKTDADRARLALEAELAAEEERHAEERGEMERQLRAMEAGIVQREGLIEELQTAEAQARSDGARYQAQLQALQQALDAKEAELAGLHAALSALAGDCAQSAEEKAALRDAYEGRVVAANAKVSELRRKLKDQDVVRSSHSAEVRADRLRDEVARLKAHALAMKGELMAKVHAHERTSQSQARELAKLRRAADVAQGQVRRLEQDAARTRQLLKQREAEAATSRTRIRELSRRPAHPLRASGSGGGTHPSSSMRSSLRSTGWPSPANAAHSSLLGSAPPRTSYPSATHPRALHPRAAVATPPPPRAGARGGPGAASYASLQGAGGCSTPAGGRSPAASTARAASGGGGGGAPLQPLPPRHQGWLDRLVDTAAAERRCDAALRGLRKQAAALAAQRARVESEHERLSARMGQRLREVHTAVGQLEAQRAQLMEQLAGVVDGPGVAEGETGSSLGQLVQAAEEVEHEARADELRKQLSVIEARLAELQGTDDEGGAWTHLHANQQQLLDRLGSLLAQLDARLSDAAHTCANDAAAWRSADAAMQRLRVRAPNMTPADLRRAVFHLVDVVVAQQGAVDAAGMAVGVAGAGGDVGGEGAQQGQQQQQPPAAPGARGAPHGSSSGGGSASAMPAGAETATGGLHFAGGTGRAGDDCRQHPQLPPAVSGDDGAASDDDSARDGSSTRRVHGWSPLTHGAPPRPQRHPSPTREQEPGTTPQGQQQQQPTISVQSVAPGPTLLALALAQAQQQQEEDQSTLLGLAQAQQRQQEDQSTLLALAQAKQQQQQGQSTPLAYSYTVQREFSFGLGLGDSSAAAGGEQARSPRADLRAMIADAEAVAAAAAEGDEEPPVRLSGGAQLERSGRGGVEGGPATSGRYPDEPQPLVIRGAVGRAGGRAGGLALASHRVATSSLDLAPGGGRGGGWDARAVVVRAERGGGSGSDAGASAGPAGRDAASVDASREQQAEQQLHAAAGPGWEPPPGPGGAGARWAVGQSGRWEQQQVDYYAGEQVAGVPSGGRGWGGKPRAVRSLDDDIGAMRWAADSAADQGARASGNGSGDAAHAAPGRVPPSPVWR
ncbi:hypothetical protein FOA52_016132 [Chlamydomonas sp. UWO 241]|nr:hypothetical protein FOA52_016132 [Chlamydomonas sp. UWO 241]